MKYFLALALCFLAAGCSEPPPADGQVVEAAQAAESARLEEFFARTWDERLALSPQLRSRLGSREGYGEWDDISDAAQERRQQQIRRQYVELGTFDYPRLDAASRLSYGLFEEEANRRIEQYRWRHHDYLVNHHNGIHTDIPAFLTGVHRVESEADALAYIERLRGIGPLLLEVERRLAASEAAGIIPPAFTFPLVAADIRRIVSGRPFERSGADSALLADFRSKVDAIDLTAGQRAALLEAAGAALVEAVGPAYASLLDAWQQLERRATGDDGVWKLPDGNQYYRSLLRWYTTTDLTPAEVHDLGLAEVARVQGELAALMPAFGFRGPLTDFFAHMQERPDAYFPDTDAGREAYLAEVRMHLDAMRARLEPAFGAVPEIELVVQRVEPFRERTAGRAFYVRPAADGSRPGTYYVNLYRMADMPRSELEALAYHEGLPGHHLQRSITQHLDDLPEFRRRFPATAFTEGWGLYAERLARELGGYRTALAEYGRLVQELNRAVRLVVDTGIHARQWTRTQAIDYHLANTPVSRTAATRAVDRYLVYPGQATAYMVGMLRLVELRERARTALGPRFDLREFHQVVLGQGPVSLFALERIVGAWIERTRAG